MKETIDVITVNNVKYVRQEIIKNAEGKAKKLKGLNYVIIRTFSSGVFAGYLKLRQGDKEVHLVNARRIWYWAGAATLSQLSVDGVTKPKECKFPCEVDEIILTEAIEIIQCTEKARLSIQNVPVWAAK